MARTRQPQPSVPSDTFKELEKAVEELEHSGAPQVLNRATSPFYARLSLYFKPDEVQEVNLDLDKLLPTPRAATRDDARDLRGNFLHWRSVKGSFERLFPRVGLLITLLRCSSIAHAAGIHSRTGAPRGTVRRSSHFARALEAGDQSSTTAWSRA